MHELIYRPTRTSEPEFEPIRLDEAKKQVELPQAFTRHDSDLLDLIRFAREQVEHDTGIVAAAGTFTLKLDQWPSDDWIGIPLRPVSSITSIAYVDNGGTSQVWASDNYSLSAATVQPNAFLAYGSSWPSVRGHYQDITLTFVAGYASQEVVPSMIKRAVKLALAREFYDKIANEVGGGSADGYAKSYEMLIRRLQRCSYP